jgi:hypothetical protein
MQAMRKLPVVHFSVAPSGKSKPCSRASRTHNEGRFAIVTNVGSGMRWTLAASEDE